MSGKDIDDATGDTLAAPVSATDATAMGDMALAATAAGSMPVLLDNVKLAPGDRAGDYTILRRIGGGAMGDVYEGEAKAIGKRVAIKVIKHVLATSDDAAQRFLREARAVNRIDHPNVLDVFAFGQLDDGRMYLVMDLLVGESLGQRLRETGALDEVSFLATIEPMCRAIDAAHAAGIVHRDLKPDNVFLAEQAGETHVYVLDFGIAKLLADAAAEEGQATLTGEGVWIGTPAYMSPEQWAADETTNRTDIYALGCTAFEMLTGRVPFAADSVPGIMQKHFNAELPELERIDGAGAIRPGLGGAIEVAMAKDPSDRFESAAVFLDALRADAPAASATGGRPAPRVPLAAVILSLAVLLAAGFVIWQRMSSDEPTPSASVVAGEIAAETVPEPASTRRWSLKLETIPKTAILRVKGHEDAVGLLELSDLPADAEVSVVATALGYTDHTEAFALGDGSHHVIGLTPIDRFEAVWEIESVGWRQLKRHEDGVAVFSLESEDDKKPQFLQTFRFTSATTHQLVFAGSTTVVDERAPDKASCRFVLTSEYRWTMVESKLDFRRERLAVHFNPRTRQCREGARDKTDWIEARRATLADNVVYVMSRGSGALETYIEGNRAEPLRLPTSKKRPPRRPDPKALARKNAKARKLAEQRRQKEAAARRQRLDQELTGLGNVSGNNDEAVQQSDNNAVQQRKPNNAKPVIKGKPNRPQAGSKPVNQTSGD